MIQFYVVNRHEFTFKWDETSPTGPGDLHFGS